jgi:hypothetical protein
MNSRVVTAIARKDLVDAIRNRYLLMAVLTPLLVAVGIRLLLPDISELQKLKILAHDPGNSKLIAQLRATPRIEVVDAGTPEAARNDVEKSGAAGGLVVPADFDANLVASKQPEVTVYVNNKKNIIEQAAFRQLLEQQIMALAQQPKPVQLVWTDVAESHAGKEFDLNKMLLPLLLLLGFGMTGALTGSFLQTTMQVNTWASLVLLLLLAPSFPLPGAPATLENAMRVIPTYYFVESLKMSLTGDASSRLLVHSIVVVACTLFAFAAAIWTLRREQN